MKKLIMANTASGRRRAADVFRDFCELAALTIRNSVDKNGWDEREDRHLHVSSGYTAEENERFAQLLAAVTMTLGEGLSDALGDLYMTLELGNERLGQFFTPYDISRLVAKMSVGDPTALVAQQGYVRLHEPAVGSGGMVIATAEALRDLGINYQSSLHVVAQDLDRTAVHMSYIQLSLLGIPALVIHGNTLTNERLDVWPTPAHYWGGWSHRLRAASNSGESAPAK